MALCSAASVSVLEEAQDQDGAVAVAEDLDLDQDGDDLAGAESRYRPHYYRPRHYRYALFVLLATSLLCLKTPTDEQF